MSAFTVTASLASRVAAPASTTSRRAVVAKAGGFTPDKNVGDEPVVFFTDKNGDDDAVPVVEVDGMVEDVAEDDDKL